MVVNNLYRFEPDSNMPGSIFDISKDGLSFSLTESVSVDTQCGDYPFKNQTVYRGDLHYHEQPDYGAGRKLEFEVELRADSGLFILQSDVDVSLETLIERVSKAASDSTVIYKRLTPSRHGLWEFIGNSDSVIGITLIDEFGDEIDYETLDNNIADVRREFPIEDATFAFSYGSEQIVVRYNAGSLQINTDKRDATEYVLQLFERDVVGGNRREQVR